MPRILAYIILAVATTVSAVVIEEAGVEVYTVQTELVLTLDKAAEFSLDFDPDKRALYLEISAKTKKNVTAPPADGLISGVEITPDGKKTGVAVYLDERVDNYRAYATVDPATIVLQVFRRYNPPEIKPEGLDILLERLGDTKILLVDDDDGPNNGNKYGVNVNEFYEKSFDLLGVGYDTAIVRTGAGGPAYDKLAAYPVVIWFTGLDARPVVFSGGDMSTLKKYVDGGGRLIIASQNLISDCGNAGRSFCTDLTGAHSFEKDTQVDILGGAADGPFADFEELNLTSRLGPIGNWGDGFKSDGGTPFFAGDDGLLYGAGGEYGSGKAVIFTFAPENLAFERKISRLLLNTLLWLTDK
jgi:hypothetical protein